MFYDRNTHRFYSRRLLPVTKQSRIPVPLGSRHDPWKDWEEDFRELCNTESNVVLQLQANEGTSSWETDFDEACGLDHDVRDVDFAPKAVGDDESDQPTALSISIDNFFSVSTAGSCNANHGFRDSTSSMVTIVPITRASGELQMPQTSEPILSPTVNSGRIFNVSERQQSPQRNVNAENKSDGLPDLPEDAFGRDDTSLQTEPGVLLFDMKSQQGSEESESTSVDSSSTASFSTNSLQLTNARIEHDVPIVVSNVGEPEQERTVEDLEASHLRAAKHDRAGAISPILYAIYPRGYSNERVAAMLGLESCPRTEPRHGLASSNNAPHEHRKDHWPPLDWDDEFEELCTNAPQTNLELAAMTATEESPQDDSWVLVNKPGHSINFTYTFNIASDQKEVQEPQILEGTVPNAMVLHTTPGAATPDTKYESVTSISARESEQNCSKNLGPTAPHDTLYTTFCNVLDSVGQGEKAQASATEVPRGSEEEAKKLGQSSKTPATIIEMVKSVGTFLWDCWNERPLVLNA